MKKILIIGLLFMAHWAFGQNGDFTIVPQNLAPYGTCHLGDTVIIKVGILNTGQSELRKGSVLATLNIPSNGQIVGFIPDSSTNQFVVSTTTAGKVEMINSGATLGVAPFDPSNEAYMYFKMKAINQGGPVVFKAFVQWNPYNGTDSLNSYALQGNTLTGDDTNQTSLTVTAPLAVNFTNVSAQWTGNDAKVSWTVAQESGTNYFGVERSFDGKDFENVGNVKSKGDHTDETLYAFMDNGVKLQTSKQVYYRIREVALDTRNTLSKIVSLTNQQATKGLAYIYPNPISNAAFTFVYENDAIDNTMLDLNISDALGRNIYHKSVAVKKGKNEIPVQGLTLTSGMYHLRYSNSEYNIDADLKMVKD